MDEVQALIERIRKSVLAEAEQKFADETFQQLRHSLHNGRMRDADGFASVVADNGTCMEVYLKFVGNRVDGASYVSDGCSLTCLCGSCLADMAIGKTPVELLRIGVTDLLKRVQRSGEGIEGWALLTVEALHKAVERYWVARHGQGALQKLQRRPRFVAVGRGTSYRQHSH
ncbi:MAG: iron-sulfur cluster assembly scaffold protein [Desulfopila sp.]